MRIKWGKAFEQLLAVGAIYFILAGPYLLAQNLARTRNSTWRSRVKPGRSRKVLFSTSSTGQAT